jgi:ABC-type nitrate/sulfonate/bicarbonate transport system substrate-binding protein
MTMAPTDPTSNRNTRIAGIVAASAAAMAVGTTLLGRTATVILAALVITIAFTLLEAVIRDDVERTAATTRSDLTSNLIAGSIIAGFLCMASGIAT